MKIYATRNDNIFDRFVGKPVWIKVTIKPSGEYFGYIQILDKLDQDQYKYHFAPVYLYEEDYITYPEFVKARNSVDQRNLKKNYTVVTPIEVITQEEMEDFESGVVV